MKKVLCLMCLFVSGSIFAEWHPWDFSPTEGQMIMTVYLCPGLDPQNRQILVISTYSSQHPAIKYGTSSGWWDVGIDDIPRWLGEGSKVLYLPSPVEQNFIGRVGCLLADY